MSAPLLAVYGLSVSYGDRKVVSEISFELERGEILALLGPNGSGKSTLLKTAAGILPLRRPGCEGLVKFKGTDLLSLDPSARARTVAYVSPELHAYFPLTALEAVLLGATCAPRGTDPAAAARAAMERCLCWNLREQSLQTLSGGERQLVALARALTQGARILFLDEALSRMDLNHQAAMGQVLRELAKSGYAIVLVAHDLNLASEWASTGLLLKDGKRLAHGPIASVITEEHLTALYPGWGLTVGKSPATGTPKVFFSRPEG